MPSDKNSVQERMSNVLRSSFPEFQQEFDPELETLSIPGWDSTAHVGVMIALEDEFGITFEDEEYTSFHKIGELTTMIEAKLV